jgi:hypothetical protein
MGASSSFPRSSTASAPGVLTIGGECDCIEFMVAQHCHRAAGVDHPSHEVYHLNMLWPPVDEISHEHHLPVGVSHAPLEFR